VTPQQIVGLAARLFAVFLAVRSLQAIAMASALQGAGASTPTSWVPYAASAIYLVAALVLWYFPLSVGHTLVPRTRFENKLSLPLNQFVVVASVILGMFVIVVEALPPVTSYLSVAAFWVGGGQKLSTLDASRHIDGLVGFAQLAAGIFLVSRPTKVSQWVDLRELPSEPSPGAP